MAFKVGIVGATGYAGEELIRILCRHPEVTGIAAVSRDFPGSSLDWVFPHLRGYADLEIMDLEEIPALIDFSDLVFIALPHGLSAPIVQGALRKGKRVVDLAADFRLPDPSLYEAWYQMPHGAPELLREAVYGLPELFRSAVCAARLVANPGCYPTGALLALAPLLKHGLADQASLIIDAKSGVSGAGRTLALTSHFAECNENVWAYSVATHRHTPEIAYYASILAGGKVEVTFTPHLIPMTRGILSTVYANLLRPCDASSCAGFSRSFTQGNPLCKLRGKGNGRRQSGCRARTAATSALP
jgi:N-acetyl-gamma-glutamyl-phosphate reductase